MNDAFYEFGRQRAHEEHDAVEWAIDEIQHRSARAGIDLSPLVEQAETTLEVIPSRHRAAFEGMADGFDVDRDVYAAFVFSFAELAQALALERTVAPARVGASGSEAVSLAESLTGEVGTEGTGEGCTNALVSSSQAATDGPLVSKNRDIVGRGVRPVSVLEQPAMGPYHGYITVDTCGSVLLYKGVNDAGLVAANTHIAVSRDEVGPEKGVRNGTLVRRILEECETVAEARELVESYDPRLFTGHSLALADESDSILLEVDPIAASIHPVTDPVVTRTNHFLETESPIPESSDDRLERARALLEDAGTPLDRADLEAFATDHEDVPGEYSICRHAGEKASHHAAFGQETTVSASIFEGGRTAVDAAVGYPCLDGFTRFELGEEIPEAYRSGAHWLAYAT